MCRIRIEVAELQDKEVASSPILRKRAGFYILERTGDRPVRNCDTGLQITYGVPKDCGATAFRCNRSAC